MSKGSYFERLDMIGAVGIPGVDQLQKAQSTQGRAILIRVKNVPALVAKQGGAMGQLAQGLLPDTIDAKVYSTMQDQLSSKLKEQGVDADVQVVVPAGFSPAGSSPFWRVLAIVAGGTLAVMGGAKVVGWVRR